MAVPTPEQRRGGGLLPGLRISGPLGVEAAKTAEKAVEGNPTELVRIKIASFGGKKVGSFGQALTKSASFSRQKPHAGTLVIPAHQLFPTFTLQLLAEPLI